MKQQEKQELINLLLKINIEEHYINLIDAYLKVENDTNQIITFIKRYIKLNSKDFEKIRNYLYYLNSTAERDTFMGLYKNESENICPVCKNKAMHYCVDGGPMMSDNKHEFHMCDNNIMANSGYCKKTLG